MSALYYAIQQLIMQKISGYCNVQSEFTFEITYKADASKHDKIFNKTI